MIFLTEAKYSLNGSTDSENAKSYSLAEAHIIYKALYKLDVSTLLDIREIVFLAEENFICEAEYYEIFYSYTACKLDYSEHRWAKNQGMEAFPNDSELADDEKVEGVLKLFRKVRIEVVPSNLLEAKQLASQLLPVRSEYITMLSVVGRIIDCMLPEIPDGMLKLYSDLSYFNSREVFQVELKNYVSIKPQLSCMKQKYDDILLKNKAEAREFHPENLLNTLGLDVQIRNIKKSDSKRAFIKGEDKYLVTCVILALLPVKYYHPHEMPEGLSDRVDPSIPNAFLYINRLDGTQIISLLKKLDPLHKDIYAFVHDAERKDYPIFTSFDPIDLTKKDIIRSHISAIFIFFLLEHGVLADQKRLLYPIVRQNLFNPLLEGITDLNLLTEVIYRLKDGLTIDDSLFDPSFWLQIDSQIASRRSEKAKDDKAYQKTIEITKTGDYSWKVRNLGETDIEILCKKKNFGLLYIMIIYLRGKRLSLLELRKLFILNFGDPTGEDKGELKTLNQALQRPNSNIYNTEIEKQRKKVNKAVYNLLSSKEFPAFSELEDYIVYQDYHFFFKSVHNTVKFQLLISGFTLEPS